MHTLPAPRGARGHELPARHGVQSRVLVEQTRVVDPGGLGSSRGQLESSELRELDSALALVLGL